MFAIVEIGGQQYKVEKGAKINVNRLNEDEGKKFTINKVLLVSDNSDTTVGTPYVSGASVEAKVETHLKDEKIRVFKMKAKKRYQKTYGHRQSLTTLEITDIKAKGASPKAATAKKKEEKEEA